MTDCTWRIEYLEGEGEGEEEGRGEEEGQRSVCKGLARGAFSSSSSRLP